MSQSKVLADRIYSGEGIAADALRIFAANILLVLCAHIVIPLPWTPVPITGQTFGVLLVAVLLGARRGAITLIMYLLEGAEPELVYSRHVEEGFLDVQILAHRSGHRTQCCDALGRFRYRQGQGARWPAPPARFAGAPR